MKLSKSFLVGTCVAFFGLLILSEIALRLTVPMGFWYRHFDISGDMTSLAELRDRLSYSPRRFPDDRPPLLLGDSVLGASALKEHRIPGARQKTLSYYLKENIRESDFSGPHTGPLLDPGFRAISLGSYGILLPDIEGLSAEFSAHPPEKILLLLNFRMFSKEFGEGKKAISRHFLLSNLSADLQKKLASDPPPTEEAQLSDRLYAWMCDHWFLFRETQAAKVLWYYPSQKDFFQRGLEHFVKKNEAQSDIIEAALKQKVVSYYQPYLWDPSALPLTCLKKVLDDWTKQHIPVEVVLTPQNRKFLGSDLDKPSFEKNRKTLESFMKAYRPAGLIYRDWADRYPSSFFLDHCHLTPEGNEQYAKDLANLPGKGKP